MLLDSVGTAALSVVRGAFDAVLPVSTVTIPDLTGFVHWYSWLNGFLPLSEALQAYGYLIVLYGIVFALRTVILTWQLIPGKAT